MLATLCRGISSSVVIVFVNLFFILYFVMFLQRYCLTPYRGVRYHLKEWGRANERPQNKEELFNLRHSSRRNVIERGKIITFYTIFL